MDLRLVLPLLLVAGGAVVAFAGAAPQAALDPTTALATGEGEVAVKGMVLHLDADQRRFVLTDGKSDLHVELLQAMPAAVVEQASLVAKGTLVQEGETVILRASEVLIGCPSKYE